MNAKTYDLTGPDGGYIVADHGYYADVTEYIRAGEFEDPQSLGAPVGADGFIRINYSLCLEHRPLREYRNAVKSCGYHPRGWRRVGLIEALTAYGYADMVGQPEYAEAIDA